MFKALMTGACIAIGFAATLGTIGVVAASKGASAIETAMADLEARLEQPVDDLEVYAVCVKEYGINLCRDEFRVWFASPTYAAELDAMAKIHPDVYQAMADYDNSHPNDFFN